MKPTTATTSAVYPDGRSVYLSAVAEGLYPKTKRVTPKNVMTEQDFFLHVASIIDQQLQTTDSTMSELRDMLIRLRPTGKIIDGNALEGWKIIHSKCQELERDIKQDALLIVLSLVLACCGQTTKTELMVPSVRKRWKEEVEEKAYELAKLVRDSGVDDGTCFMVLEMQRCYNLSERDPLGFGSKFFEEPVLKLIGDSNAFFTLSEFLLYVAQNVDSVLDKREPFSSTPSGGNLTAPKRAYFANHLNRKLKHLYGAAFPVRTVLKAFICAAFDDPNFSDSQLSRILK